ncbi:MAG: hypothetical protein HN707_11760 [Verrucomicrobia bacterium]|nr:hypothetical protein [Verrucomicrobiota bacterium]
MASATPNTLHEGYSLHASEKLGTVSVPPLPWVPASLLPLQPFNVIKAVQVKATAQFVFLYVFFIIYSIKIASQKKPLL